MVKKGKTSKTKQTNKKMTKMKKQGKLKLKRNKKAPTKPQAIPPPQPVEEDEEVESDHGESLMNMVDADDIDFLKKAVVEGSYSMFHGRQFRRDRKLLKRQAEQEDGVERMYEDLNEEPDQPNKKIRYLLPIKTKGGLVKRAVEENVPDSDSEEENENAKIKEEEEEGDKDGDAESDDDFEVKHEKRDLSKPISMAEMLAWREQTIAQYKLKIGILCSGLLEDPQNKVLNIARLLEIYDDWRPELQITLRKVILVSLMEVFKDILPSYQIKHQEDSDVLLKKETRALHTSEKSLLKGYRGYLTKLEKAALRLVKKKGDTRVRTKGEIALGELAVRCLGELLKEHPYFNYSKNIVRLLVPYFDCNYVNVRNIVYDAIKYVFAHDKKGEITLEIVRRINDLVKSRKHCIKPEAISVMSHLKINVNLDQMKEAEIKDKKLKDKKSRIINLSKKEKKRQKRIKEVEKELLETKAEENKKSVSLLLTETTKMVFTIYFRILKSAPSSGLLSATLQGLAKFAHCINLEFYQDMVLVLHKLMSDANLKLKEQLNCILTVFRILSGQGEALTIDPNKFYAHLYANMSNVSLGKRNDDSELLLQCLEVVILGRRKKLTQGRLLAFIKRAATISLMNEHHVALALLTLIKQTLQVNKSVDILLDVDSGVGQGVYLPELPDPEYCHASRTALFELSLLQNHYHPTVRNFAENIANGVPPTGKYSIDPEISKLTCFDIYDQFNPNEVAFKPSVPPPRQKNVTNIKSIEISNTELASLCARVQQRKFSADFSLLLDDKKFIPRMEALKKEEEK